MIRVFAFEDKNHQPFVGVEWNGKLYHFTRAWEIYKQIKLNGEGPSFPFIQLMLEMDLFHSDVFNELFDTLKQYRPLDDLIVRQPEAIAVPIQRPSKIVCVGRNYGRHALELGNQIPDEPILFAKAPSSMIATKEPIRLPKDVGRVDYEGEIALVIGKTGRNIDPASAMEYVGAYTLVNDVTARDLQKKDKERGLPWFRSKSIDTFCPIGPCLVPASEITDPHNLTLTLRVNDEERQKGHTGDLLFPIPELISYISKYMTLYAGDIIATGTPEGVGPLHSGDWVEVEVPEIGLLRNQVL